MNNNPERRGRPSKEDLARMRERRDQLLRDPAHRERLERIKANAALGIPAYAFVDGSLPGGAIARVVRDAEALYSRMIIFSLPDSNELSLPLATTVLFKSEIDEPELNGALTIDVLPDRTILRTRQGTDPEQQSVGIQIKPSARQWQTLEMMKKSAAKYPSVTMAGLGSARIIPPVRARPKSRLAQAAAWLAFAPLIITSPLWAFRLSPLRAPLDALNRMRDRKLNEEWRKNSKLAATVGDDNEAPMIGVAGWAFHFGEQMRPVRRRKGFN